MKKIIFAVILSISLCGVAHSTVLLSENFDSWSDYRSEQYPPSPWCDSCGSTGSVSSITLNSTTHSATEVLSPGMGGTGKSLKTWRNGSAFAGNPYYGSLGLRTLSGTYNALYFRWYMKVPTAFSFANSSDQKIFRYNTSDGGEIYFNFQNSDIQVCPNSGGADCFEAAMAPASTWHDGGWHAHQIYINLATSTITYWLDGVQTYHKVGVANMPSTSANFGTGSNLIQHFPFGNSYAGDTYQSSWQAIDVDNLIIATTKAESDPIGGEDTSPPTLSAGSPSGALAAGTTSTTMSVTTDEAATCKYSTSAGVAYASMANTFSTTGGTSHSVTVSGLSDGGSYNRYVRCSDSIPNVNTADYAISWTVATPSASITPGNVLFSESFSDNSWSARSWYDGTDSVGSTAGGYSGNGLKWTWTSAATQPTGFSTIRAPFTARSEFMVEYWTKMETGWRGSGQPYHPHMIHIMSTDDGEYQSLNVPYNNLYFEAVSDTTSPYAIRPFFAAQDTLRVNTSNGTPPNNLVGVTETRSAFGCNTPYTLTSATGGGCDDLGGGQYYSVNMWKPPTASIPSNTWTRIRYYVKKNTFTGGVANFDGIIRAWVDDTLILDDSHMMYAANAYATTAWNKIVMAPWIGDGSPLTQAVWIDELKIYDGYTEGSGVGTAGLSGSTTGTLR